MDRNQDFDSKIKQLQITDEISDFKAVFQAIDIDQDGYIDRSELLTAMHHIGYRSMKEEDVAKLISQVDLNNDMTVGFDEFLQMISNFQKSGKETAFIKVVKKGKEVVQAEAQNANNISEPYSEEERSALVKVINTVLKDDDQCKTYLPIHPDTKDVFRVLKDGIILCKLINKARPGTIDERVINKSSSMAILEVLDNLKLALNAAKSIGCQINNISPEIIIEEKYTLVLHLLWQIIKQITIGEINLKNYPQMIRLLKDDEVLSDLLKLHPEEILLRWFNYHLNKAGYSNMNLTNFSDDIKDCKKYIILLNQLNETECLLTSLDETDIHKRAEEVLLNSKKLGAEDLITPQDIIDGNEKLNTLFITAIFNACHGLNPPTEQETYETAQLLSDDAEGSREERAFRMWINCLGLCDFYVNNLYEECRSGLLLLNVIEKVFPGTVDWKMVDAKTQNKFKKVVNCNEAVNASKKAGLNIIGIGGQDIHEANKKYILAIVWQLMRHHTLQVIGNKTEDDLVKWANECVTDEYKIQSLKDNKLKNSLFFIYLMNYIESRAINWDLVIKDREDDEALENNAKYALSIARKLGASLFVVWEDIREVKSNMLLTFLASLYDVWQMKEKDGNK